METEIVWSSSWSSKNGRVTIFVPNSRNALPLGERNHTDLKRNFSALYQLDVFYELPFPLP